MKKILLLSFCLLWFYNLLNAQSQSLPYSTGFDSISQQAGWQEFRLGILNSFNWKYETTNPPPSSPNSLFHDYNVGGGPTDTTEDWFVSPSLNFNTSAQLNLKLFAQYLSADAGEYFGIWFGTGSNNPANGNFYELANLTTMQTQFQWIDTSFTINSLTDSGYIAFKYINTGDDWFQIFIDDINIIPINNSRTIDSLKIIPNNPTTNDTVKVISYTMHPNSDCSLTNSSVSITNDTITVNASYTLGMLPTICNSIDTLTIGVLNAGTYELTYHLADTAPPTTYDIDTIMFTVQQLNTLQHVEYSEKEIRVYPNPTISQINIELKILPADRYQIDFYSILGQKIKTVKTGKSNVSIDISDLTQGVYFITITDRHGGLWTRKVIKNAP